MERSADDDVREGFPLWVLLEGGHQPLSNEDGTVWAAHNGEVYNYPELRSELEAHGHVFKTGTDTEIMVHCYEEWGEDFVQRLRGMFASAVWDGRREKLIIIRDRLGIKPLYYTQVKGKALVFGSELKSILAHSAVERTVDPSALDLFLTLEYIPAPFSIFQNIHKLPAGCKLVLEQGKLRIQRYWDLEENVSEADSPMPPDQAMDELYELLKESVRMRLLSDVPLGAFLSGGIDSSCIVGLMRELGVSPLKTFSIGFEDKSYDELNFARKIVESYDANREEVDALLSETAEHWALNRINMLDKAILRLAVAEMMGVPDVPYKVSISEAIELAKIFSTEESGRFVNGILDAVAEKLHLKGDP